MSPTGSWGVGRGCDPEPPVPNLPRLRPDWSVLDRRALQPALARAQAGVAWVSANDPVWRSFRRPGPAEAWAGGAAAVMLSALVAFLLLFDWNLLRGPIGRWASATYHRDIQIRGDLDVRLLSWTPSVRVEGLRIGGPQWAAEKDTVKLVRGEGSVRLASLLRGRIEIPELVFTRPELVLIADAEGRQSWRLDPNRPDDGAGMKLPPIQSLTIVDGVVTLDEQRRRLTLNARVNARENLGGDAGFRLEGDGSLNGSPLTLVVEGGPFVNIRRDRPYRFTARLKGAGSSLEATGAITRPFDLGRFDATLKLDGQDLADLYLLTGLALPNTPRYSLEGRLARRDARFELTGLTGRVGSSDLSGQVIVDKAGDRRRVEADLRSRSLDLDDLTAVLGAEPQVTPSGTVARSGAPGRLLPDAPLRVERLRVMDGTLRYRAQSVKRNAFEVRQVDIGAELKSGVLNLDPVAFDFAHGSLKGTARIDARRDTPYSAVDFRLAGYPLESIIPARNGAATVSGRALGRARLEGPGASVHDFAARSKGSISLVVPQGRMRAAFAELLGINVGAGLAKLLSGDQSQSRIRCAVADFDVSGGMARARTLVIDTDVVRVGGSGSINLANETLDLRLDGETKKPRLLRVWSPILVTGPMVAPRLGVDAGAVAAQGGLAAAFGALLSPLAAILPFVDPGLAEDANCGALISGAR